MKTKSSLNAVVKESIEIALIKLMENKHISNISITELVQKAGVGRASFYRNFSSKEDVVRQYINKITINYVKSKMTNFFEGDFTENLISLFTHLKNNHKYVSMLIDSNLLYMVKEQFDMAFKLYYKVYDYKLAFLSGGLFNTYSLWVSTGMKETPDEIAKSFTNSLAYNINKK